MGNFYFESMTRFAKGYFNKLYLEKKKLRLYLNRLERLKQPINDNKYAKNCKRFRAFLKIWEKVSCTRSIQGIIKGYLLV